jgi:hypothetical protein
MSIISLVVSVTRPGLKTSVNAWIPVVLWAAVIFWGSHQQDLPKDQVVPFIEWLCRFLRISTETAITVTGHFVEYAVLGYFLRRGLILQYPGRVTIPLLPGYGNELVAAFIIGTLYALTDEYHQSFVPGRVPSLFDIATDFLGLAVGIFIHRAVSNEK